MFHGENIVTSPFYLTQQYFLLYRGTPEVQYGYTILKDGGIQQKLHRNAPHAIFANSAE